MPTYVLTLLHFNLQYCAGGLGDLYTDWPTDNDSIEDQIIDQSFSPVLDLLDRHPTWTFDIELQAYMIEVLAARRPDVLDHLRTLEGTGQVELISFHYSDQLWTAYPWQDEEKSLELTRQVFDDNGLTLADVVWTQEGQFGQGELERMPSYGPDGGYHIAVMPHNLAEYTWGHSADSTLYSYEGGSGPVTVIPGGQSYADANFSVSWSFLDDGELYATNDMDPYLGPAFLYNATTTAAREADLAAQEAAGAQIIGVHDYVAAVSGLVTPTPLPPVIDGTWQPDDTTNMWRWMGGSGLWGSTEEDDGVLTGNVLAGRQVRAAEAAGGDATAIEEAWKTLLLGEVSDATGWNPYETEVQYAEDHAKGARGHAQDSLVNADGCRLAGSVFTVDLGTVGLPDGFLGDTTTTTQPLFDITASSRAAAPVWRTSLTSVAIQEYEVDVSFFSGDAPLSVTFPWDGASFVTAPALLESPVQSDPTSTVDPFGVALPSGLLRLSDRTWLLQDTAATHLAAVLSRSAGTATFTLENQPSAVQWVYRVVHGDSTTTDDQVRDAADADAVARNLSPRVELTCPPDSGGSADNAGSSAAAACGCTSTPSPVTFLATMPAFLALLSLRRRTAK